MLLNLMVVIFYLFYILLFSSMISEVKHETIKGTGLKILTPKEIFQRLSIALPQVKAGSN